MKVQVQVDPVASPVKIFEVPAWLLVQLRMKWPDVNDGMSFYSHFLKAARYRTHWTWLDHWGIALDCRGDEVFVSEPYGLHSYNIEGLMAFCDDFDLRWDVDAVSVHKPPETIRIWISKKKSQKK